MYCYSIQLSWPSKYESGAYGYEPDKILSINLLNQREFLSKLKEEIREEIKDMLHMCFPVFKGEEINKELYTQSEGYRCFLTINKV